MLDHHHALATGKDSMAKTMVKLELEDIDIVYIGMAVGSSKV